MKNLIAPGKVITYTVPAATTIAAGEVVKVGNLYGIAVSGGTTDDEIALNLTGAYELAKKASLAITQGDALYWDADPGEITKTVTDGNLIGYAYESAAGADDTVIVIIGGGATGAIPPQAALVAALGGTLTGTVEGTLANVADIACAGGSTPSATNVNTAVNGAILDVNLQLKELQTTLNAVIAALKAADIMASA